MDRIIRTVYGIMALTTAIIEFKLSIGFFTTALFTILGLLFWPIFWAVWMSRPLLGVLRAHGMLP